MAGWCIAVLSFSGTRPKVAPFVDSASCGMAAPKVQKQEVFVVHVPFFRCGGGSSVYVYTFAASCRVCNTRLGSL